MNSTTQTIYLPFLLFSMYSCSSCLATDCMLNSLNLGQERQESGNETRQHGNEA